MNRKSRIIFIGIILCAVMGACALLAYYGGGGSDNGGELGEASSGTWAGEANTPAALGLEEFEDSVKKARRSTVTIGCDVPEVPERMEVVSWEVKDVASDQRYLEGILGDNPEKKAYKLKPRGGNDFHQSKEYPYFYLPYVDLKYGFELHKNTEDGITRSRKFTKKQVLEKVSRVLEHFSLSVEPMERWEVKKNISYEGTRGQGNDCTSKNNYQVKMYQAFDGFPVLDTGGYVYKHMESDSDVIFFEPLEFCYGDAGWLRINLEECLAMKGTGQYVRVLTLEEIASVLEDKVGGYNIAEAKLGYWFGDGQTLRPFWYVDNGGTFQRKFYCIDAETGTVYGESYVDNRLTVL